MKDVIIQIPESVPVSTQELRMMLAAKLYEKGYLSSGQAAQTAGYSKRVFLELLGSYGVSIFNYPDSDLEEDLANA